MRAIVPCHFALPKQTQISFVDQRGGLQGMARTLPAHAGGCQPAQFVVDHGGQLVGGPRIAAAELTQKSRYLSWRVRRWVLHVISDYMISEHFIGIVTTVSK